MTNFKTALTVFRRAAKGIPAYKTLLKNNKINPARIITPETYATLPVTDKQNYIRAFPKRDLIEGDAKISQVYASSGSSGQPTFWLSHELFEDSGGEVHRTIFENIFGIKKNDRTLVVVCFSLGLWIAGLYTMLACRYLNRKGYHITVVTPGLERENTFAVLKELAPEYGTVVIAGYPPLIIDVLSEARQKKIKFPSNIKILTAGDKFTELWRTSIMKLLGLSDPSSVLNLYGSADATVLGFETPATIELRQHALKDKSLFHELFGDMEQVPGVFQYDPDHIYFEEVGGELVITANTAIPLVRYNIHDRVSLIEHKELLARLSKYRTTHPKLFAVLSKWKLPIVIVKGRTDVAVTFYALNVYPENIKGGLDKKIFNSVLSGSYIAYTTENRQAKKEELHVQIELRPDASVSKNTETAIRDSLVQHLLQTNMEYHKLHSTFGDAVLPNVTFVKYGSIKAPQKVKTLAQIWGKKPRVIQ